MNEAAIVTIAIGSQYFNYWRTYCESSWREYADKHGFDVIVVSELLDRSDTASNRSPAWQKCLVLSQEWSAKYRQIVLLDSDIVINAQLAPKITDQVPFASIGGVISGAQIPEDLRVVFLSRLWNQQYPYEPGLRQWHEQQAAYYTKFGLSPAPAGIVQTGVLVASPHHHRHIFEHVYNTRWPGEDRNFEQIPLSHAILNSGMFHRLDSRFNSVFYETLLVHHAYLLIPELPFR
jgi:hypothetical protein